MGEMVRLASHRVDSLEYGGAHRLRDQITSYWKGRGFPKIDARLYEQPTKVPGVSGARIWVIRSNIGPKGFPPR